MIIGAVFGPLWASHSFHITHTARHYASAVGKDPDKVVFFFFGIYVFCLKFAYVPSNLLSSIILLNGRSPNTSVVDTSLGDVCNNTDAANIDPIYLYVLLSV